MAKPPLHTKMIRRLDRSDEKGKRLDIESGTEGVNIQHAHIPLRPRYAVI